MIIFAEVGKSNMEIFKITNFAKIKGNVKKKNTMRNYMTETLYIPLRYRKAGKVWCGGARETHRATYYNLVTPSKTKEFIKSSCF